MWRRSNESKQPNKVSWEVMRWEMRYWIERSCESVVIEAVACYLVSLLQGVYYSKELGATAVIYTIKMMRDNGVTISMLIGYYSNKIILEYEKMFLQLMLNDKYKLGSTYPMLIMSKIPGTNSKILEKAIMMYILEDVWKQDQTKIYNCVVKYVKSRSPEVYDKLRLNTSQYPPHNLLISLHKDRKIGKIKMVRKRAMTV